VNFEEILALLPDAKRNGNGSLARCPAHEDHKPSLSISEGADGRTLLKCFAGCSVESICSALKITPADLFRDNGHANSPARRITATYDYQDRDGKLLFQKVRYDPKDFRQRKPDSTALDGWTWNTRGVQKVLFRLPEILRDISKGKFIFLCEGEKDVLAMVKHGFAATCNPGGAGKWLDSYTETLRGADCVIIPDRDEPGRAHAQLVAGKLHGVAKSVRVLELPGENIKDAHDFFAAGGGVETVFELVDRTPEWGGDPLIPRLAQCLFNPDAHLVRAVPVFSIGRTPVSTVGNLTTITAQAKSGKTAAIGGMIAATFAGDGADCLGFTSKNPKGFAVLHLDTEQSPFDHAELVRLMARRAGQPLPVWLLSYCLTGFKAADIRRAISLLMEQAQKQFGGVHSVFLDGVADAADDVNDPAESNAFVAELHGLAIKYDCTLVSAIHLNPGSDFKTRGHLGSQLERKAEANLKIDKEDEVCTLWAEKNRHAPILKNSGPRFAWDDEQRMHVSIESQQDARADAEFDELSALFKSTFASRPAMHNSDLRTTVTKALSVAGRTADRKIARAVTLGIIKKTFGGLYELAT
jgi:hypothetical protein